MKKKLKIFFATLNTSLFIPFVAASCSNSDSKNEVEKSNTQPPSIKNEGTNPKNSNVDTINEIVGTNIKIKKHEGEVKVATLPEGYSYNESLNLSTISKESFTFNSGTNNFASENLIAPKKIGNPSSIYLNFHEGKNTLFGKYPSGKKPYEGSELGTFSGIADGVVFAGALKPTYSNKKNKTVSASNYADVLQNSTDSQITVLVRLFKNSEKIISSEVYELTFITTALPAEKQTNPNESVVEPNNPNPGSSNEGSTDSQPNTPGNSLPNTSEEENVSLENAFTLFSDVTMEKTFLLKVPKSKKEKDKDTNKNKWTPLLNKEDFSDIELQPYTKGTESFYGLKGNSAESYNKIFSIDEKKVNKLKLIPDNKNRKIIKAKIKINTTSKTIELKYFASEGEQEYNQTFTIS